ncbi:nuclear transport factor 2 family protein [Streptomyces sp. NPDC051909]|uniref:nuclear transport factor 2 family protein n=1 Tax=Streptomyces sp. NPDC051909 TaxID=3154944 RepID=UPI0034291506
MSKHQVESTALALLESYCRSDFATLQNLFTHDDSVTFFGTHEDLRFLGWNELAESLAQQLAEMNYTEISVKSCNVNLYANGFAACVSLVLDYRGMVAGKRIEHDEVRLTLAMEKSSAGWRIVQCHWSIPRVGSLLSSNASIIGPSEAAPSA